MLEDKKIIEIEHDYIDDHALDFLVRWYTGGKKDFMGLSSEDKKKLKLEIKSFDRSEVKEFSSSSIIENHHKTSLVASNAQLSGDEKMKSSGVDLVHIKDNKLIFMEVKGTKEDVKKTPKTLITSFKDTQDKLLKIHKKESLSKFSKVLYFARGEKYKTETDIALNNMLDYKNGKIKELKFDFDLMAVTVSKHSYYSEKFYDKAKTKQCLIEVSKKPSNFGDNVLDKLSLTLVKAGM